MMGEVAEEGQRGDGSEDGTEKGRIARMCREMLEVERDASLVPESWWMDLTVLSAARASVSQSL